MDDTLDKFQPGDIVSLITGGPEMVVIEDPLLSLIRLREPAVTVIWLDKSYRQQTGTFPAYTLRHVARLHSEADDSL